jgi:hypothetical protein
VSTSILMQISFAVIISLLAALGFFLFYFAYLQFRVRRNLHLVLLFIVLMLLLWIAKALTIKILYTHTVIMYLHFALIGVPVGWVVFMIWKWVRGTKKHKAAENKPE